MQGIFSRPAKEDDAEDGTSTPVRSPRSRSRSLSPVVRPIKTPSGQDPPAHVESEPKTADKENTDPKKPAKRVRAVKKKSTSKASKKKKTPASPAKSKAASPAKPAPAPAPTEASGGKGKGKGVSTFARRHKKVLRENIQGITKPAIRRMARRGGVKRISNLIYEETRGVLRVFLEHVIRDAVTYTGMHDPSCASDSARRTRATQDRDRHGRGLVSRQCCACLSSVSQRTQTPGPHPVRIRRLSAKSVVVCERVKKQSILRIPFWPFSCRLPFPSEAVEFSHHESSARRGALRVCASCSSARETTKQLGPR